MPQGHRDSNQPVVIKSTGKLMVTEQNHGYSVEVSSISADKADITMINVNDGSCEGLEYKKIQRFWGSVYTGQRPRQQYILDI